MDLHSLSELTETPGPYATVYLDASHDSAAAGRELELRWAGHRTELAEQGADEPTLAALDRAVADADPVVGRGGRVLVAVGRARAARPRPARAAGPPGRDLGPGTPLMLDAPEPVNAVVVRVDRSGGEIMLAGPGARPEKIDDVTGTTENLHKVKSGSLGDWSIQRRVEQNWHDNIAEVAAHIDTEVTRTGAQVLVLAGEAQARSQLRDALGERAAAIAVDVEHSGGRSGGTDDQLAAAVDAAARDVVTAARQSVLDRLDQETGRPDGLAVGGLEPVLQALRAQQVDILLLDSGVERPGGQDGSSSRA